MIISSLSPSTNFTSQPITKINNMLKSSGSKLYLSRPSSLSKISSKLKKQVTENKLKILSLKMLLMYSPSKSYINILTLNLHNLPKCSLKSSEPYNLKSNSLKRPKHLPLHLTFSSTPYLRNCQTYSKTSILIHLFSCLN